MTVTVNRRATVKRRVITHRRLGSAMRKTKAFISHSSADLRFAMRVDKTLKDDGVLVWLDRSEIHAGALLRNELQTAIQDSSVLVLLWSKHAAKSRWVAAELLTAFHHDQFIVPCVLDKVRLPQFLQNTVYLDLQRGEAGVLERVCSAVRDAPNNANPLVPIMNSQSYELEQAIQALARAQMEVMNQLGRGDLGKAKKIQALADEAMRKAEKAWRFDSTILNLGGYHRKNEYTVKHWDAIQAGRPPKDSVLVRAERFFFDTLFVDPTNYSALNGLGSILIYERDLDAAEFFIRRAISIAERDNVDYPEAKHDLEMILRYKKPETTSALRH